MPIEPKLPRKIRRTKKIGKSGRHGSNDHWGMSRKDYLDLFIKLPAAVVVIFYVTGIFVQSIYFSSFGIVNLSLIKISYVLSGMWFFLCFGSIPLFCSFTSGLIIAHLLIERKKKSKIYKAHYIPVTGVFTLMMIFLLSAITFDLLPFTNHNDALKLLYEVVVITYTILTVMLASVIFYQLKQIEKLTTKLPVALLSICLYLIITGSYIKFFSSGFYGLIPAHLGGGELRAAMVSVELDAKDAERLIAENTVPFATENPNESNAGQQDGKAEKKTLNIDCELILETEEGYYLEINQIIFMPRGKVNYIAYLPRKNPINY